MKQVFRSVPFAHILGLLLLFTLGLGLPKPLVGQVVPIGAWKSYLPYSQAVAVTQTPEKVWFATPYSLLSIDKDDFSYGFLNKVNGLSDSGIRTVKYNAAKDILVVVYDNNNIDLVKSGEVVNIPDIKNKQIQGDITLQHLHFDGDLAYLAYPFGLVAIDVERNESPFTTFTNYDAVEVYSTATFNGKIFISTSIGICEGDPNTNLSDFGLWKRHTQAEYPVLPASYVSRHTVIFGGRLWATVNDTLEAYDGTQWQHINARFINTGVQTPYLLVNQPIEEISLSLDGGELTISSYFNKWTSVFTNGDFFENFAPELAGCRQVIRDEQSRYWIADLYYGAVRYDANGYAYLVPNSPQRERVVDMTSVNGTLWCASGAHLDYVFYFFNGDGIYRFENNEWAAFNRITDPAFIDTYDVILMVTSPVDGRVYAGSFGWGLFEWQGETFTRYMSQSTSLGVTVGDPARVRITGLDFDENGNLWIANHLAERPISVKKTDGTWRSFINPIGSTSLANLAVDANGYKWIQYVGGSLLVYDSGSDIDNENDDRYANIETPDCYGDNSTVFCMIADRQKDIWVGTDKGIIIYRCGNQLFANGCDGERPVLTLDNFNSCLLGSEKINCIATDGANRKWVGTNSGAYLISADGSEQLLYFNVDNSPLLDNVVTAIEVEEISGEVFIATASGLVSYRGTATKGVVDCGAGLTIFPNPFRPSEHQQVAVSGLLENANVKIVDVSGTLVHETNALGGQVVWDGRDYTGRLAASGVYLVLVADDFGGECPVGKIMLLHQD